MLYSRVKALNVVIVPLFLQGPQKSSMSSAVMRLTLEFRRNTVHNVK